MKAKSWLLVFTVLWSLSGCATAVHSSGDVDTEVRERVMQRWQYLLAGKLDEAYAYLSPGSRERIPAASFKGGLRTGLWRDAKVLNLACEADVCKVEVEVTYQYVRPNVKYESARSLHETWVREGGQWWYVLLR